MHEATNAAIPNDNAVKANWPILLVIPSPLKMLIRVSFEANASGFVKMVKNGTNAARVNTSDKLLSSIIIDMPANCILRLRLKFLNTPNRISATTIFFNSPKHN